VYGRKLSDRTVEFGHEGILYRGSFIMYDRGTKSLWVHTTGECVKGELKGRRLEFIPSVITSWGAWKKQHPETVVLEGKKARGFMGRYALTAKSASRYGISVGQGDSTRLYPVATLLKNPVVSDRIGERDIIVFLDPESLHATAWVRGKREFRWKAGKIVDGKGRVWERMLGRPVKARDDKERMTPVPATAWLIERWKGFYPASGIYVPPTK